MLFVCVFKNFQLFADWCVLFSSFVWIYLCGGAKLLSAISAGNTLSASTCQVDDFQTTFSGTSKYGFCLFCNRTISIEPFLGQGFGWSGNCSSRVFWRVGTAGKYVISSTDRSGTQARGNLDTHSCLLVISSVYKTVIRQPAMAYMSSGRLRSSTEGGG